MREDSVSAIDPRSYFLPAPSSAVDSPIIYLTETSETEAETRILRNTQFANDILQAWGFKDGMDNKPQFIQGLYETLHEVSRRTSLHPGRLYEEYMLCTHIQYSSGIQELYAFRFPDPPVAQTPSERKVCDTQFADDALWLTRNISNDAIITARVLRIHEAALPVVYVDELGQDMGLIVCKNFNDGSYHIEDLVLDMIAGGPDGEFRMINEVMQNELGAEVKLKVNGEEYIVVTPEVNDNKALAEHHQHQQQVNEASGTQPQTDKGQTLLMRGEYDDALHRRLNAGRDSITILGANGLIIDNCAHSQLVISKINASCDVISVFRIKPPKDCLNHLEAGKFRLLDNEVIIHDNGSATMRDTPTALIPLQQLECLEEGAHAQVLVFPREEGKPPIWRSLRAHRLLQDYIDTLRSYNKESYQSQISSTGV